MRVQVNNPLVGSPTRRAKARGTTPESRERAGMRGFPFGALELAQHPLVQEDVVTGAPKGSPACQLAAGRGRIVP